MGSVEALLALREAYLTDQLAGADQGPQIVLGDRSFPRNTLTAWKHPTADKPHTLDALLCFLQHVGSSQIEYLKIARQAGVERVQFAEREVRLSSWLLHVEQTG